MVLGPDVGSDIRTSFKIVLLALPTACFFSCLAPFIVKVHVLCTSASQPHFKDSWSLQSEFGRYLGMCLLRVLQTHFGLSWRFHIMSFVCSIRARRLGSGDNPDVRMFCVWIFDIGIQRP